MKRILFFTHKKPQGYRIQQYFPYLEKRGFEVGLVTTEAGFFDLLERIRGVDVLYIQRILLNPLKLFWVRKRAKRIIYDFDDAVMYGSKNESGARRKKFEGVTESADIVFCGNRFLFQEAEKYRKKNIYYVPTVVDTDDYVPKTHGVTAKPVAGWIGSSSTLRYISDVKDQIVSLLEEGRMTFRIIADAPPEFHHEGLSFEKWEAEKEKSALLSFDAGIMPLRDDLWSRGKCGLKLIQYMASGLPSVAHPVGVTEEMIENGTNGYLCRAGVEWKDALTRLAEDAELRKLMGGEARRTAEEHYSLKVWGPRVAEIIDSL